jgi:hypothetical protein
MSMPSRSKAFVPGVPQDMCHGRRWIDILINASR